ncbi:MAG TPA: dTDP-4-amino-4,6-dideoxygalactose transaminase [Thermoanaerobaculia bacterium]|nr:dTDP-4-amino-4,6-dideoxygalactose transaminase [Thermoanaerobaculia bacterium]
MSDYSIPFNRPAVVGDEFRYMREAAASGKISGDGEFSRRCHAWLEREFGAARALLTTSCTHALEMAALLLDLAPGDEVILPSFTFVSTVNAFALRGVTPVFADVRPDTLNLDEAQLEDLVGPRTRVVLPIHYAGVGCAMDRIMKVAGRHDLAVVEDNAHGLFGKLDGRTLGTFGCMSTLSFHETKNVTCGEGGALIVNDPRYVERAEIVREKGTNRSQFFRGMVDKYSWVDVGSSYLPSDLLAAYLYAQLEAQERIQAARRRIWLRYAEELAGWAARRGVRLPHVPPGCEQPAHIFYLLLPSLADRQALIAHLKARGILAVFHYVPLHLSHYGRKVGRNLDGCPVAADISDRLLRLPLFYDLSDSDQSKVIAAVHSF